MELIGPTAELRRWNRYEIVMPVACALRSGVVVIHGVNDAVEISKSVLKKAVISDGGVRFDSIRLAGEMNR